jgi:hypothetical protein
VLWLRWLTIGLSPLRTSFDHGPVHVRFEKQNGNGFCLSSVSVIQPVLHFHIYVCTVREDKRANAGNPQTNQCSCRYLEAMGSKVLLYWLVRASVDYSMLITQSSRANPFGGAFAKLRRATVSFVMSVWPSIRMEQRGSHRTDFHEIWYLDIFRKSLEKVEVSLKSDKNNGYFTWRPMYVSDHISLSS